MYVADCTYHIPFDRLLKLCCTLILPSRIVDYPCPSSRFRLSVTAFGVSFLPLLHISFSFSSRLTQSFSFSLSLTLCLCVCLVSFVLGAPDFFPTKTNRSVRPVVFSISGIRLTFCYQISYYSTFGESRWHFDEEFLTS